MLKRAFILIHLHTRFAYKAITILIFSLSRPVAMVMEMEIHMEYNDSRSNMMHPLKIRPPPSSLLSPDASSPSSQSPTSTTTLLHHPPHSPSPPSPPPVIMSPCAACKILRRRCSADKCVLAPYFPPTEPHKFTIAHRVFGASNIIKLLQDLPESERADAVSSMVYEANARIRDPVYGCAGTICHLQTQVIELQAQLAKARAEVMQLQQANLVALICMEMSPQQSNLQNQNEQYMYNDNNHLNFYPDEGGIGSAWEALWA